VVPRSEPVTSVRLEPSLAFLQTLWALDHSLQIASKRMERSLRLTGPQRLVLRIVSSNPRIGAGDLARVLHLHPSTLTGILRRLGRQHLLQRHRDPADARRALLTITESGQALLARHTGTVEAAVTKLLRRQPGRRVGAVRQVLQELALLLRAAGAGSERRSAGNPC